MPPMQGSSLSQRRHCGRAQLSRATLELGFCDGSSDRLDDAPDCARVVGGQTYLTPWVSHLIVPGWLGS